MPSDFSASLSSQLAAVQSLVIQEHGRVLRLLMHLEHENDTLKVANNRLREQLGLPLASNNGTAVKAIEAKELEDANGDIEYLSVVPCLSVPPAPPAAITNRPAAPSRPMSAFEPMTQAGAEALQTSAVPDNHVEVLVQQNIEKRDAEDSLHSFRPNHPHSCDMTQEGDMGCSDSIHSAASVKRFTYQGTESAECGPHTGLPPAKQRVTEPAGMGLPMDSRSSVGTQLTPALQATQQRPSALKANAFGEMSFTSALSTESIGRKSVRLSGLPSEGPLGVKPDRSSLEYSLAIPGEQSFKLGPATDSLTSDNVAVVPTTSTAKLPKRMTLLVTDAVTRTASRSGNPMDWNRSSAHSWCTTVEPNTPRFTAHQCWVDEILAAHSQGQLGHDDSKKDSQVFDEILDDEALADPMGYPCCEWLSRKVVLHPGSAKRLSWDLFGFLMVFYDGVIIPLQFFDPPKLLFTDTMSWIARLFWTIDMALSFFTGFQTADAHIEVRVPKIARNYLSTWFILDAIIVMIDWMDIATTTQGGAQASRGVAKTMRTMRVLRAVRLLRLVRLLMTAPEVTGKLSMCIRSEEVMIVGGILKIVTMVSGIIHVIACCWYGIGKRGSNWVSHYNLHNESLGYRYACSFHWALTQFIGSADILPQNHGERAYSVVVLMVAFVTSGVVVSSITTSMTRLQIVTAHYSKQLSMLRRYLIENNISSSLAARVQRNARHIIAEQKKNISEASVELLHLISNPLRVEIHFECYGHVLMWHPFFKGYHTMNGMAFRHLCHVAVTRMKLSKGDVCFSTGETPQHPRMFYLVVGNMMYTRPTRRPLHMETQQWACEVHLWIQSWVHCGQLRATSECDIICLDAEKFRETACNYKVKEFYAGKYAQRFVTDMNEADTQDVSELVTEAVNPRDIAKDIFPRSRSQFGLHGDKSARSGYFESVRRSHFGKTLTNMVARRFSAEPNYGRSASRVSGASAVSSRPSESEHLVSWSAVSSAVSRMSSKVSRIASGRKNNFNT